MKAVILCGGMGTRLREETEYRPKPMVVRVLATFKASERKAMGRIEKP